MNLILTSGRYTCTELKSQHNIKGNVCNFLTEIKRFKVYAIEIYTASIVCGRQEFKFVSKDFHVRTHSPLKLSAFHTGVGVDYGKWIVFKKENFLEKGYLTYASTKLCILC